MGMFSSLRILAVITAFIAGLGAILMPRLGQPELSNPLMTVGFVFFLLWFVLFVRSKIPE